MLCIFPAHQYPLSSTVQTHLHQQSDGHELKEHDRVQRADPNAGSRRSSSRSGGRPGRAQPGGGGRTTSFWCRANCCRLCRTKVTVDCTRNGYRSLSTPRVAAPHGSVLPRLIILPNHYPPNRPHSISNSSIVHLVVPKLLSSYTDVGAADPNVHKR